jgi:hypothetical protein
MHPLFVKLFLDTEADDFLTEERTRRRARRARHHQQATVSRARKPPASNRSTRP